MANESIIQVPPNVADPIVLQRFLLRLVEEMDILLGRRGASADEQYVAQKDLLAINDSLQLTITEVQAKITEAIELLEEAEDDSAAGLTEVYEALASRVTTIENTAWIRPLALAFAGQSTNGAVATSIAYNISSGIRTAIGVYAFTLTTATLAGINLLAYTQATFYLDIADSAVSEHYAAKVVVIDAAAGTFEVHTFAIIQGAGTKLSYTPHDPLATDIVSLVGSYTPPGLTL